MASGKLHRIAVHTSSASISLHVESEIRTRIRIISSSQTCRSYLTSLVWNWFIPKTHWRSYIWSRVWILCRQPAPYCHCTKIIIINVLTNGIGIRIRISASVQLCRSCSISRDWNWLMPEMHWISCIWSRGWIHGSLPEAQWHSPYILSINVHANRIKLSSSSQTCRSCLILWF